MHRRRRQPLLIVLLVLTSLGLWHRQATRGPAPTSPVAAMRSAPDGVPQANDLPLEVESPVTRLLQR